MTPPLRCGDLALANHGTPRQHAGVVGHATGLRASLLQAHIHSALTLNALLREKHEGPNLGNPDPPVAR